MIHQVVDQFLVPVHWMDKASEGQPCQDHVVGAHGCTCIVSVNASDLWPSSLSESGTAALSLERSTTLYYTLIISQFVKFFIITFNISL